MSVRIKMSVTSCQALEIKLNIYEFEYKKKEYNWDVQKTLVTLPMVFFLIQYSLWHIN